MPEWWPIGKCQGCGRYFSKRRRRFSSMCSTDCVDMVLFYRAHPEMAHVRDASMRYVLFGDESSKIDLEWFFLNEKERFRRSGGMRD